MTDQNMPAEKVREIAAAMRAAMRRDDPYYSDGAFLEDMSGYIRDLEALLPNPPLPTLADMSPEKRRDCEWMQCDVAGLDGAWLIIDPFDDEDHAHVVGRRGNMRILPAHFITPRPDLPNMEWTGDKKPDPASNLPDGWRFAEHPDHGRVIITNTTPNRLGNVYFVAPTADYIMGYDCRSCDPDELTYLPQ